MSEKPLASAASERVSPPEPFSQNDRAILESICDLFARDITEGLNLPGVARLIRRCMESAAPVRLPALDALVERMAQRLSGDGRCYVCGEYQGLAAHLGCTSRHGLNQDFQEMRAALAALRGAPMQNEPNRQAMEALAFAHGAIVDAVCCEDGLDGLAGERVLRLIRAALLANGETPPDVPDDLSALRGAAPVPEDCDADGKCLNQGRGAAPVMDRLNAAIERQDWLAAQHWSARLVAPVPQLDEKEAWFVNLMAARDIVQTHSNRKTRHHLLAAFDETVRRLRAGAAPVPAPQEKK